MDIREVAKRAYEANMQLALEELKREETRGELVEKCLAAAGEIVLSFQEILDQEIKKCVKTYS